METLELLFIIALLVGAIIIFIRYEPKLDLIKSKNKYILLLWYNKYNLSGIFMTRAYIKLFKI